MKYLRIALLVFSVLILYKQGVEAQVTISSVSLRAGCIETRTGQYKTEMLLYPELQIGGRFFTDYFHWEFYGSYWDDGISEPFNYPDYITYNFSARIIGCRIGFLPANVDETWRIPLEVFVGFAEHFYKAKYIGGSGYAGDIGYTYSTTMPTFELGLSVPVKLFDHIELQLEGQQYFPLEEQHHQIQHDSWAFKIGLRYLF